MDGHHRQLLGDVAGVHRIRGDNNDAMPTAHCASVDEAVALLADDPLQFEPGTQHRYSIWGWVLVSAAVEKAAGEPFPRFMVHEVFEPLAMDRTVVAETEDPSTTSGTGRERSDLITRASRAVARSCPRRRTSCDSDWRCSKPGLLRAETIDAFRTPTRLVSGASTTYALGWTVRSVQLAGEPSRVVSHRGSPAGGTVSLLTFPDLGLAVAVAANVADARGVDPFALRVAEAFTRGLRTGRSAGRAGG